VQPVPLRERGPRPGMPPPGCRARKPWRPRTRSASRTPRPGHCCTARHGWSATQWNGATPASDDWPNRAGRDRPIRAPSRRRVPGGSRRRARKADELEREALVI